MVLTEQRGAGPGLGEQGGGDMAFSEGAVAVVALMVEGAVEDHKACQNETVKGGTWEVQLPLRPQILCPRQAHFRTHHPLLRPDVC